MTATLRAHPWRTAGAAAALALVVLLVVTVASNSNSGTPTPIAGATSTTRATAPGGPGAGTDSPAAPSATPTAAGYGALAAAHTIVVATCENSTSPPTVTLAGFDARTGAPNTADPAASLPSGPTDSSLCLGTSDQYLYTMAYRVREALTSRATSLPPVLPGCPLTCVVNPSGTAVVTQDYNVTSGNSASVIVSAITGGAVDQSSVRTYTPASGCAVVAWLDDSSVLCIATNAAPDIVRLNVSGNPPGAASSAAATTLPLSRTLHADGVGTIEGIALTIDRTRLLVVGQTTGGAQIMYTATAAGELIKRTHLTSGAALGAALVGSSVVAGWTP